MLARCLSYRVKIPGQDTKGRYRAKLQGQVRSQQRYPAKPAGQAITLNGGSGYWAQLGYRGKPQGG